MGWGKSGLPLRLGWIKSPPPSVSQLDTCRTEENRDGRSLFNASSAWRQDQSVGVIPNRCLSNLSLKACPALKETLNLPMQSAWCQAIFATKMMFQMSTLSPCVPQLFFTSPAGVGNGFPFVATFPMMVSLLTSPLRPQSCANYHLLRQKSSNISRKPIKSLRKLNMRGDLLTV